VPETLEPAAHIQAIVAEQIAAGLPGLAGSEATAVIRLTDQLLNRIVAAALPEGGNVRTLTVQARAGNMLDATIVLAKPAFLPALNPRLTIERQPTLPDDPVLALRISGGAASLLKFAGPFLGSSLALPAGMRLEQDLLLIDLRALLDAQGQGSWLRFVRELVVTTQDSVAVVAVAFKV
jgi:hypothetical protein